MFGYAFLHFPLQLFALFIVLFSFWAFVYIYFFFAFYFFLCHETPIEDLDIGSYYYDYNSVWYVWFLLLMLLVF